MLKFKIVSVLLISVGVLMAIQLACTHKPTYTVCFKSEVLPIYLNNCAMSGCHDANTHEHGVVLDSYENIMKHVTSGKPLSSEAYTSIVGSGEESMPPNKTLPSSSVAIIKAWIEQGADTLCQ